MDLEMQIPSKVPKQDKKERKRREPHVPLATYYDLDKYQFEIGIDEAGRGPMLGRLYVAGVVLPKDGSMDTSELRDSKKISKKKLPVLYEHIIKNKPIPDDIQSLVDTYYETFQMEELEEALYSYDMTS